MFAMFSSFLLKAAMKTYSHISLYSIFSVKNQFARLYSSVKAIHVTATPPPRATAPILTHNAHNVAVMTFCRAESLVFLKAFFNCLSVGRMVSLHGMDFIIHT